MCVCCEASRKSKSHKVNQVSSKTRLDKAWRETLGAERKVPRCQSTHDAPHVQFGISSSPPRMVNRFAESWNTQVSTALEDQWSVNRDMQQDLFAFKDDLHWMCS